MIIGSRFEKSPGVSVSSAARTHLALVDHRLGVIALHVPKVGLHPLAVGVAHTHYPLGNGGDPRLWSTSEPPALIVPPGRPIVLIGLVGNQYRVTLILQSLGDEHQPRVARAGDMIGVLPAMLLELPARFPRPTLTPWTRATIRSVSNSYPASGSAPLQTATTPRRLPTTARSCSRQRSPTTLATSPPATDIHSMLNEFERRWERGPPRRGRRRRRTFTPVRRAGFG